MWTPWNQDTNYSSLKLGHQLFIPQIRTPFYVGSNSVYIQCVTVSSRFFRLSHNIMYYSYFHEAPDGLEPETEFIYDLEIPSNFTPTPRDGEVSDFYLWDIEKVCNINYPTVCI